MAKSFIAFQTIIDDTSVLPSVTFIEKRAESEHKVILRRLAESGEMVRDLVEVSYSSEDRLIPLSITRITLGPAHLKIEIAPESASLLYGQKSLVVAFGAPTESFRNLKKTLKHIFRFTRLFVDDSPRGWDLFIRVLAGPATPSSEKLVLPTYCTFLGSIGGIIVAGAIDYWWIPVGLLAGVAFGYVWGLIQGLSFYDLHDYK